MGSRRKFIGRFYDRSKRGAVVELFSPGCRGAYYIGFVVFVVVRVVVVVVVMARESVAQKGRIKQTIDRPFSRLSHGYLGSAFELFMPGELSQRKEIFLSRRIFACTVDESRASSAPRKGTMMETKLLC